jgi:hypothetical protein
MLVNGIWEDISASVQKQQQIVISRGRGDETGEVAASTCTFTIQNSATGDFTPGHPLGRFYPYYGRNTKVRVSVPYGSSFLRLGGDTTGGDTLVGDELTTPDSAALSVTGDIDVRIDLTNLNWYGSMGLIAKYNTSSNQRSWSFDLDNDGVLSFSWSPDGTLASRIAVAATEAITPGPHDRLALRATLDVDNGASGNTVRFYTSDTISGSWTQLGDAVVTSGTTSIFNSTASVGVGYSLAAIGDDHLRAHVHALEIRNGIAGTVVGGWDISDGAFGAVPYVASTLAQASGVSSTASATVSHAVAAGDTIALVVSSSGGATVNTVSDSKGNTYTLAVAETAASPRTHIYTAPAVTALTTSDTISVTFSTAAQAFNLIGIGCSDVLAVDVSGHGTGTSTSPSATTATTLSGPLELAVAAVSNGNGGGAPSWAAGWTSLSTQHTGSTQYTGAAYKLTAGTSAVTASATITSATWTAVVATFTPVATTTASQFVDPYGNTWSFVEDARIDDRDIRFTGELSDPTPTADTTGQYRTTTLTASGIFRRLEQGASPLRSTMFREHTNPARANIVDYWPMEDASEATQIANGIPGGSPMMIAGTPSIGNYSEWTASDAMPTIGTGKFTGRVRAYTPTGEISVRMFVFVDTAVAAETSLIHLTTNGSAKTWDVRLTTAGQLRTRAYDDDGNSLLDSTSAYALSLNSAGFTIVDLELTQNGANVDWSTIMLDFTNTDTIATQILAYVASGTVNSQTTGAARVLTIGRDQALGEVVVGHLAVANDIGAFAATNATIAAQNGERPSTRIARLAGEENLAYVEVNGKETNNTVQMGDQQLKTLKEHWGDAEDTDGGVLSEPRDRMKCVAYRTRTSLYNQVAALTLTYSGHELFAALAATFDDRFVRNHLALSRVNGSKVVVEQITGPLNTSDPEDDPDGVGRYDSAADVSLVTDDQLADVAGWRLHLGTVAEARYNQVLVNLRHSTFTDDPEMARLARALDMGDRIVVESPPSWLTYTDISQIVQGHTETLDSFEHTISFTTSPERPYQVWQLGTEHTRIGDNGDSTTTAAFAAGTDTSMTVATTGARLWTTTDEPFNVVAAGVELEVTAVSGASSPQTFTVTATPVNGVEKTIPSGSKVQVADPIVIAL